MSGPTPVKVKQSPLIDDMILTSYIIAANTMGMLILAACGLWQLEHGLDN